MQLILEILYHEHKSLITKTRSETNKRKTCISSRSRKKSVHDPYNSTKRSWKEEGIHT